MSISQPPTLACVFCLFVCGSQMASAAPPATEAIQVAENPTRWTLTTQNSSYQIILIENNDLTPGYFEPLSSERLLKTPYRGGGKNAGTVFREIPYRGG